MQHSLTVLITLAIVAITVSVAHAAFVPYYGALYFPTSRAPTTARTHTTPPTDFCGSTRGAVRSKNTQNVNMELLCGPASGADVGQLATMELCLNWYNGSIRTGPAVCHQPAKRRYGNGRCDKRQQGHFCFQGQYNEMVCQLTAGVNGKYPFQLPSAGLDRQLFQL